MVEKQFSQGDIIIREGDYGDSIFQILSGSAAVLAAEGTPDEKLLTVLHEGEWFGEMAVLEGYARSATIKAMEDGTSVNEIQASELSAYFEEQPEKIMALMNHLGRQIRQLTRDYEEVNRILDEIGCGEHRDQSEGFQERIRKFLGDADRGIMKPASEKTLQMIYEGHASGYAKRVNTFPKGTVIFREGDEANCMFDIHWGRVGIYSGYGTAEQKLLTELNVNSFFGEMGMIGNEPRSATAVTLEDDTTLETIYPEDLEDLFRKNPPKVEMIFRHMSFRLRRLTVDYLAACRKLAGETAGK